MGAYFSCRKKKKPGEQPNINMSREFIRSLNNIINSGNSGNQNIKSLDNIDNCINQNQESIEYYKNLLIQKDKEIQKMKEEYEQKIKILEISEPILVGLDNIGASCYMNAIFQCLSNTTRLTEYFLKKYKYNKEDKNKTISNEYYNLIKNLWNKENDKKSISPNSFNNILTEENPLLIGGSSNEPKELISFLLERFHQELNLKKIEEKKVKLRFTTPTEQLDEKMTLNNFLTEFNDNYHSIISDLFYGVLKTQKKCQGCNNIIYNFNVFSFLEFPLEQVNKYCFNKGLKTNEGINIYECFNYYGNMEMMTGENQIHCEICQEQCDALYRTSLYSSPNYLIIIVNRGKRIINECNVIFPVKLNILNYVNYKDGNTYYELYAVICHIGPSSTNGQFIAYCKNKINKKWYKYDDSIVTPCNKKDEYKNGMPYILFYQAL